MEDSKLKIDIFQQYGLFQTFFKTEITFDLYKKIMLNQNLDQPFFSNTISSSYAIGNTYTNLNTKKERLKIGSGRKKIIVNYRFFLI